MGRVHTPSVISPALRWGTIAVVLAASLAIAMTRMCRAVTIPAKAEPPAMSGGATDVLKTASATAESWRAGIERDAQTVGVATPTDTEMTKKLTYRLDDEARVIAPGEGALEVAGLRLTASAVNEAGSSRQAMILTVENLTDTALAYNVVTTPRPGGAACNQRTILGHDAIVVAAGGKQVRSECVYRPGMSLAIARVETLALGPLSSAYVSRVPPAAINADPRLTRGHRPDLPAGMGVCSTVASQSVRADIENGTITWRDLVDFYARHSCQAYQFPEGYKAFDKDGARPLPAVQ